MVCFVWFIWCVRFVVLDWLVVLFWIRFALVMMCCAGGFGGACALVADFVVLVVGYFVACDSWFALGCCFWFICILRISWGTLLFILFGLLFVCLL